MADVELNSIGNGDGTNYLVRDNSKIPLSGTNALSGSIVPSTDNTIDIGSSANNIKALYSKNIYISGTGNGLKLNNSSESMNISVSSGAAIDLCGKDYTYANNQGKFILTAVDGNTYKALAGSANGTLTWGSKNVAMQEDTIPRSGGAVLTGKKLARVDNGSDLDICGGTGYTQGGYISVRGKNSPSGGGSAEIGVNDGSQSHTMRLGPTGAWAWTGTACQITSDQRLKQQITQIDDALLDAWEDVNLVQFKYNDAVDQKGKDKARLHTGYVVQQIDNACKSHGVDISEYGLYCHEEYPEETEEVEVEQADGTKTKERKVIREASEHYSLRYTEALIVECAYLRKKNKDLQEQLNALSERLEKLENR